MLISRLLLRPGRPLARSGQLLTRHLLQKPSRLACDGRVISITDAARSEDRGKSLLGPPVRNFHLSSPTPVPALLLTLLKPMSKIAALVFGRKFRIWYRNLSEEEQQKFWNKVRKNQHVFVGLGLGGLALTFFLYVSHLETCPLTGRKKFVALREDQIEKIAFKEFQELLEQFGEDLLPDKHPAYARVARVANRILRANRDLQQVHGKDWTITVVNSDIKNAFVLPSGNIFVFTGMLHECKNDDQLGIVISHEISHCLLRHVAEKLSYVSLVNVLVLVPLALLWALLPTDGIALVADWFFKRVVDVVFELPFSRGMETEADEVGLVLAAKACLDVTEAPRFWAHLADVEREEQDAMPEFASTHPSHVTRHAHLTDLLPSALRMRLECGCSRLGVEERVFATTRVLGERGALPRVTSQ